MYLDWSDMHHIRNDQWTENTEEIKNTIYVHGAKIIKNQTHLVHLAWQAEFHNFERSFFNQVALDAKNVLTFEKHSLVPELKLILHETKELQMVMVVNCAPSASANCLTSNQLDNTY